MPSEEIEKTNNSVYWKKGKISYCYQQGNSSKKERQENFSEDNSESLVAQSDHSQDTEIQNIVASLPPGNYFFSYVDHNEPVQDDKPVYLSWHDENVQQVLEEEIIDLTLEQAANYSKSKSVKKGQSKLNEVKKVKVTDLIRPQAGKRQCCFSESEESDVDTFQPYPVDNIAKGYKTVDELVNDLQEKNLINEEFKKLLLTGISEMKVNILKQLHCPRPPYELLSFAYLIFYKQRPAYNYLKRVFTKGWPTKYDLRDWRKLVNSKKKRLRSKIST